MAAAAAPGLFVLLLLPAAAPPAPARADGRAVALDGLDDEAVVDGRKMVEDVCDGAGVLLLAASTAARPPGGAEVGLAGGGRLREAEPGRVGGGAGGTAEAPAEAPPPAVFLLVPEPSLADRGKKLGGGTALLDADVVAPAETPKEAPRPPGFDEAGRRPSRGAGPVAEAGRGGGDAASGEEDLDELGEASGQAPERLRPAAAADAGLCLGPVLALTSRISVRWHAQLCRHAQAPEWWKVWHEQPDTSHAWYPTESCSVLP